MAGILIIAHAPFATALRECVAHIYGGLPARIGVIDVMPDCDPVEVRAFGQAAGPEVLCIVERCADRGHQGSAEAVAVPGILLAGG